MYRDLRRKYGVYDLTGFDKIDEKVKPRKSYKYCIISGTIITLINSLYFGSAIFFYFKYIHNTTLNKPEDIDETYNKLKYLVDYACNNIPNVNC